MTRITIPSLLLTLAMATLIPTSASAQCNGTELFCASVSVGAHVHVAPPPPVRAQVVVVTPAPPPPPPVVYVEPAPPPAVVVYHRPPPATVHVAAYTPPPPRQPVGWGLHGRIGGMISPDVHMGGVTGALRLRRPQGHLGLDLGVGAYAGQDFNGLDRVEVPLTADALLYINPRSRLQLYGVAGLGFSFAHAEGFDDSTGEFEDRDFSYFGGQLGAGLELRISRWFAISGDVRGFMRTRIDSDDRPEFVEREADGTQRSTDTSGGVTASFGATLYF